jgi:hypothetical protein
MTEFEVRIESILGGQAASSQFQREGEFTFSRGIDPDQSVDGLSKMTGWITPTKYTSFSGANVSGAPMWLSSNPQNQLFYAYMVDGKFVSYTAALGSETLVGTPTSGAGNGLVYYNDYYYLMTPTDVSRYGKLSGTPSLTNTVWTGATLGSQSALTNTVYPSGNVGGVNYPNHVGHSHSDGALYFLDFASGQGLVHKIKTDSAGADDGSAYNVLNLPFGFKPTCIESYGTDLVIGAIQQFTTATNLRQGTAALFFWDAVNSSTFYRQVPLAEPLVTALKNVNGRLIVFQGNSRNGSIVGEYLGGYFVDPLVLNEEGFSPYAGAVDVYGSKMIWAGANSQDGLPVIHSLGYKDPRLPINALHTIAQSDISGGNGVITALKFQKEQIDDNPAFVFGSKSDSATQLEQASGTGIGLGKIIFTINVGEPYELNTLEFPLDAAVVSGMQIIPTITRDNGIESFSGNTVGLKIVSTTLYTDSEQYIRQPLEDVRGNYNFTLKFDFVNTVANSVGFPIIIKGETLEGNKPS